MTPARAATAGNRIGASREGRWWCGGLAFVGRLHELELLLDGIGSHRPW